MSIPKTCSIATCTRPHYAKGWCNLHWRRARRTGDPLNPGRIVNDDAARWWSKIEQLADGCWRWTGYIGERGYGLFLFGPVVDRHGTGAHKFGYELLVGPVPDGMQLDHLCRNRWCVNPAHLEPVTAKENVRRGAGTKLSEADVDEIRRLAGNVTQRELAARFGIAQSHVHRLIYRERRV